MSACRWTGLALGCALGLAGCVDEGTPQPLAPLDADHFEQRVQPYMAQACGTLDCHGERARPMHLYSELGLRADDSLRPQPLGDDVDPQPLTPAELAANLTSLRALQPAHREDDEQLLLSKPLAESAGGAHHVGGDLFDSEEHDGYRCLSQWLSGEVSEPERCDQALEALEAMAQPE